MKYFLIVILCLLPGLTSAKVTIKKQSDGGWSTPDVYVATDDERGTVCYIFDGGSNITSSCVSEKDTHEK